MADAPAASGPTGPMRAMGAEVERAVAAAAPHPMAEFAPVVTVHGILHSSG